VDLARSRVKVLAGVDLRKFSNKRLQVRSRNRHKSKAVVSAKRLVLAISSNKAAVSGKRVAVVSDNLRQVLDKVLDLDNLPRRVSDNLRRALAKPHLASDKPRLVLAISNNRNLRELRRRLRKCDDDRKLDYLILNRFQNTRKQFTRP